MKNDNVFNLPLKVEEVNEHNFFIYDSQDTIICDGITLKKEAKIIVRSVNEHDKLKAELKEAKTILSNSLPFLVCHPDVKKKIKNFVKREKK